MAKQGFGSGRDAGPRRRGGEAGQAIGCATAGGDASAGALCARSFKACPTRAWRPPRRPSPIGRRTPAAPAAPEGSNFVLWAYTATTFLSALLLFSVQPMFAKMVLPVLGGSPSVWAVAMFFFQAALLVGYCYAHLLIAKAPPALTGVIHLGVCLLAFAGSADRPAGVLGRAAAGRALSVAARPVHGGDRPAVPRRFGQCAAAAGLVRAHRASARP